MIHKLNDFKKIKKLKKKTLTMKMQKRIYLNLIKFYKRSQGNFFAPI